MLAYLISAYCDPDHVKQLIDALDVDADFYVHIDARVDDAPFRRLLPDKVHYVKRHPVSWGGYEQVEYQRELLLAAVESGQPYSHVVCLSGQDYPLWSNQRIHQFFAQHPKGEFIGGYNLTHNDNPDQLQKITHYHPFRDLSWKNVWLKNKLIVASRHILSALGFHRTPQVRINGTLRDVYFGSDYWAITLDCARYVVRTMKQNPSIASYFRTVYVPSELCMQTIIYNSPFSRNSLLRRGHFPGLAQLTPLHYIFYQGSVKHLTLDDWQMLCESDKMFCRKVVSGVSDRLVEEIDRARR